MKTILCLFPMLISCQALLPGRLSKLPDHLQVPKDKALIQLPTTTGHELNVQYLGCGGLYIEKDGKAILIDPFFSNQRIGRLAASSLLCLRNIRSKKKMVKYGLDAIEKYHPGYAQQVQAIFVSHSHYDHLMDVPAVYEALAHKPDIYLNESGKNTCGAAFLPEHLKLLENYSTSRECEGPPVWVGERIKVYPIRAGHNPHVNHIKFFDGGLSKPVANYRSAYSKTKANDWLEGNTFAFLIDFMAEQPDRIELRMFVQSSSCNPMAGVPPASLLNQRPVDIAFLGVASYEASSYYPETLLQELRPNKVVWVHWEDFFRKYCKPPKTVRSTHVAKFFKQPEVDSLQSNAWIPWPRALLSVKY